jgi:hypothetical protein
MAPEVNPQPRMENLLLEKCSLSTIHPFQLEHAMDLNAGKDLFLVIATGIAASSSTCGLMTNQAVHFMLYL